MREIKSQQAYVGVATLIGKSVSNENGMSLNASHDVKQQKHVYYSSRVPQSVLGVTSLWLFPGVFLSFLARVTVGRLRCQHCCFQVFPAVGVSCS